MLYEVITIDDAGIVDKNIQVAEIVINLPEIDFPDHIGVITSYSIHYTKLYDSSMYEACVPFAKAVCNTAWPAGKALKCTEIAVTRPFPAFLYPTYFSSENGMSISYNKLSVRIHLDRIRDNFLTIKGKAPNPIAIIKSDAYGHGLVPVARRNNFV